MRALMAWLGRDELKKGAEAPLTQALKHAASDFGEIVLLNNHARGAADEYVERMNRERLITLVDVSLKSPVDYREIHAHAVAAVEKIRSIYGPNVELAFFLNSGTPPMGAVWLLLGKSRYRAELLAWSTYHKRLEQIDVPFEVSAEFVPALLHRTDAALREASAERAPAGAAFTSIIRRCDVMNELVDKAARVALHNVPVLIEGESGTGKEILARAIHNASPRASGPFIPVNCGAIPEQLAESELFGHKKGSFTGATEDRQGHFREANGGTLFLDEIGELPLRTQVALLRPLQEGTVQPVGMSRAVRVNVRIIAATHRTLVHDVATGTFREDLFYRLAVAVLKVPALRDRAGDLSALVEHLLHEVNTANAELNIRPRTISPSGMNALLRYNWPGNVRELTNTLRRAVVWSSSVVLQERDITQALLERVVSQNAPLLQSQPIGNGFKLDDMLAALERGYIAQALEQAHGKKVEAARLLGFNSHQVLSNRMKKFAF